MNKSYFGLVLLRLNESKMGGLKPQYFVICYRKLQNTFGLGGIQ